MRIRRHERRKCPLPASPVLFFKFGDCAQIAWRGCSELLKRTAPPRRADVHSYGCYMSTNLIYISPHFPPNYVNFVVNAKKFGINVFGIASDSYDSLPDPLKWALAEYYRVDNMDDYAQVAAAGKHFKDKYGHIDRVESHNEYWIPFECALRDDLGVWGKKRADIGWIKRKSLMKEIFRRADIPVARGMLINDLDDARNFIGTVGYPVVAKPDAGVGAAATYKIRTDEELLEFFKRRAPLEYFMEEFIEGDIHTFDGLTDINGNIIYLNSLVYSSGIMEVVLADTHIYFYTARDIPPELEGLGRRAIKGFDVREKFFHFEFFHTRPDNKWVALEANIRPPGGPCVDMWNYADDIDIYCEWGRLVAHGLFEAEWSRRFHVCFVGRKDHLHYRHSHENVLQYCGDSLVHWLRLPQLYRDAMGNAAYIVRAQKLEDIFGMTEYIQTVN